MTNVVFCIAMYDENNTVQFNIDKIRSTIHNAKIIVIQSDSGKEIKNADVFKILPNLAGTMPIHKLPANAVTRNYSAAFSEAYSNYFGAPYFVALTGDTLITDIKCLDILYRRMLDNNKVLAVSQAIGQDFHSAISNPPENSGGRYQFDGITDFMPQFFIVESNFAYRTKVFSNISITNEFTTEQCLGDEFSRYGNFAEQALVFSKTAYGFTEGIKYHTK
jgi:hypothetical protein